MANLWWRWDRYALSEALGSVEELKQVIADQLPQHGYSGVQRAQDVHGFKGNALATVAYLPIDGRTFWRVAACSDSGTGAEAQAVLNDFVAIINNLHFL